MSRAKKKRSLLRINHMKKRNDIRKKMGKPVFFTLTHSNKKMSGISNQYCYKSNMHKLCYKDAHFYNVKYQASIITDCNYQSGEFLGVDFFNCNMKGTSFKNAKLKNVVFYNCNLKRVDFSGAKFDDVTFICTNLQEHESLINTHGVSILRTYIPISLNKELETKLLDLARNESLFKAKVLHVNKNKLNQWTLGLIHQKYGIENIEKLCNILSEKEKWYNMHTVFSYILLIEKWRK